jgi:hypothetical protein
MAKATVIRWKALLMLVVFAANFTVFCHCASAAAARPHCCCEKKAPGHRCNGMQAIKFNLLEKQVADGIQLAPLPVNPLILPRLVFQPVSLPALPAAGCPKHPPPDILAFQQRFLI